MYEQKKTMPDLNSIVENIYHCGSNMPSSLWMEKMNLRCVSAFSDSVEYWIARTSRSLIL